METAPFEAVEVRFARQRIFDEAVAPGDDPVDLHADVVEARQVEMHHAVVAAIVADACRCIQPGFAAWTHRGDAHGAALGIAAEQRALRTFQHFDIGDFEECCTQCLRAPEVDAVDIDADALVARGLVAVRQHADAADVDDQRARTREERGDAQAGDRTVAQVDQRLDMAVLQVGPAQHRDRDRRGLEIFRSLLRGYDDFLQAAVIGRGRRRCGLAERRCRCRGGEQRQCPAQRTAVRGHN